LAPLVFTKNLFNEARANTRLLPRVHASPANSLSMHAGVNVLLKNRSTVYGKVAECVNLMKNLGAKHMRDRLVPSQTSQQLAYSLMNANGIKVHATIGLLGDTDVDIGIVLAKAAEHPEYYSSFGGPNEPNATGPGWVQKTILHQQAIYQKVKGNPALAHITVVGPSLKDQSPTLAQDFKDLADAGIGKWCDVADYHLYPGGITPTHGLDEHIAMATSWGHPTYCTEGGYNTGVGITGHGNPVPEDVQATYAPRQLLEQYIRGVRRFFTFELLDDPDSIPFSTWESHFGLVECPSLDPATWTPKPAYDALANLFSELSDPGPAYSPPRLRLSVEQANNVVWHLFGKRDGTYKLILWQDVTVYDPNTQQMINVELVPVNVTTLEKSLTVMVGPDISIITL
jgi:hypothetical protein